jgi:DNA-binding CsgD family transcriptional regulator
MNDGPRGATLRGRSEECYALDRLLDGARAGRSGALVLRGEPGVGKTALLEYAVSRATGCRVARAAGVESEMELAFAGLHQLCAPMLDHVDRLPEPQRAALGSAFGLAGGGAPDRLLVGLAVLGLLSEVAEEQPLVCVIDDAGWLDRASAQAIAFAARRLGAEAVALLFSVREPVAEFAGLPELVLGGLRDADARALLAASLAGPLDEQVRERLLAESQGNPLALTELPRSISPAELAGGYGLPSALPLSRRLEDSFLRRLEKLPPATRRLLLVAAAEPVGDPVLLWRAAERLGIEPEAAAGAEAEQLLRVGARVTFHHPLVRSAIYRAASADERRAVHAALADSTDLEVDPDRRAWHCAQAALEPDEELASELERSAGRARSRGGLSAAAAFLERAAGLTPDPTRRALRALAGARARYDAGAPDAALALLAKAEAGPLGELELAQLERLRGQIVFSLSRGADAASLLLSAARRLERLDPALARETYLEALGTASYRGGMSLTAAAGAARAAPPAPNSTRIVDVLLDALATRFTEGYVAAVPSLRRALHMAREGDEWNADDGVWMWLCCRAALELWDDVTLHRMAGRLVTLARDSGALGVLPVALSFAAAVHVLAGELVAAGEVIAEADAITEATGIAPLPAGAVMVLAWRGEADAATAIRARLDEARAQGDAIAIATGQAATAVLNNALGRYDEALRVALEATEQERLGAVSWGLAELVESAARSGRADIASTALERLSECARASGTDWALGIEARSRALMSEGAAAESLYLEAIERLVSGHVAAHRARAHLLYGEWLRRERRRLEARDQLRIAHERFAAMDAQAFAARAASELAATGERARSRTPATRDELTPHELTIARLARDGHTNQEIGAQLFISPRTVEYHLYKVFKKLDITSRIQLARALPTDAGEPAA